MLTTEGKNVIKRYFGGQVSRIGGSIALGVGTTAATVADTQLAYEAIRLQVSSVNADLANNKIIFKGSLPPGVIGTIYEVGLYDSVNTASRTKLLSLVTPARGIWTNSTIVPDNARASLKTVKVDVTASSTKGADITGMSQDLSAFAVTDRVAVAFYSTSNIASVRVRLGTDASNYYEFLYNAPAVGYNIMRAAISTATVTGSPRWGLINYVSVRPTASAAGSGSIYFDSLSVEDNTTPIDNILVMRNVLTTPKTVDTALTTNIEMSLGIVV